jgi:hypothetical protein
MHGIVTIHGSRALNDNLVRAESGPYTPQSLTSGVRRRAWRLFRQAHRHRDARSRSTIHGGVVSTDLRDSGKRRPSPVFWLRIERAMPPGIPNPRVTLTLEAVDQSGERGTALVCSVTAMNDREPRPADGPGQAAAAGCGRTIDSKGEGSWTSEFFDPHCFVKPQFLQNLS